MTYKNRSNTVSSSTSSIPIPTLQKAARCCGAIAAAALAVQTQTALAESEDAVTARVGHVGTVFVIAMENHNLTQPDPTSNPEQILGNPAAPYLNSLMTPGNSNAAQVSFATAYRNAGVGVHPSEPNYVWAEAGSDFGFHGDPDPSPANGNTFYDHSIHLTALLDAVGVPWKNYQEDVQLSASPTNSASGNNGPVNPYNGTTQYNYAVKHNPMAFFADSDVKNVYPLAQLFTDLSKNAEGRYNWITPDQYDDAHSALTGGFTYHGVSYTGDQSAIAQGDNFLSQVVPQIMASKAYRNNGAIVIWFDETEGGDDTNHAIPEIVISPLAKGNAYSNSVALSHSSDLKTWEEIFRLPFVNNVIPTTETNDEGGYNNVATVNDLSDLFAEGVIPAAPDIKVTQGKFYRDPATSLVFQNVRLSNVGTTPAPARLWLLLDNLSSNATLINQDGLSTALAPLGTPYVSVQMSFGDSLAPHQSIALQLQFLDPSQETITYDPAVFSLVPAP